MLDCFCKCLVCRQGQAYCFFVTARDGLKDFLDKAWTCSCLQQSMPTMPQVHINFFKNCSLCELVHASSHSAFVKSNYSLKIENNFNDFSNTVVDENVEAETRIVNFFFFFFFFLRKRNLYMKEIRILTFSSTKLSLL
jgi:hypothetical protein